MHTGWWWPKKRLLEQTREHQEPMAHVTMGEGSVNKGPHVLLSNMENGANTIQSNCKPQTVGQKALEDS